MAAPVIDRLEEAHRELDFFGGRFNAYSGLCAWCVNGSGWLGDFAQGRGFFEKGLPFAREVNHPYILGWTESCYGVMLALKGDGEEAIEHLEKCIGYLEKAQAGLLLGYAWGWLGWAYGLAGDVARALAYVKRGIKILQEMGLVFGVSFLFKYLAEVHFDSGDLESAERTIQQALELSQNHGEKGSEAISRIWQGKIWGKKEEFSLEKAEESILYGIGMAEEMKLRPFVAEGYLYLGELYLARGRREKARDHLKKAEDMFQEMGMDSFVTRTREILRRLEED